MFRDLLSGAGLDASRRERVALEAAQATWLRTTVGPIAYVTLTLVFILTSDLGPQHAAFAWSLLATIAVCGGIRRLLLGPPPADALKRARWARAFSVLSVVTVAAFGAFVAGSIHWYGVRFSTMLLLVASTGVAAAVAHAFVPWLGLMRLATAALIVPALMVAVAHGTAEGFGLAALLAIEVAYLTWLGGRLHREFWLSAITRARVELAHDEVVRAQQQTRDLIERTPDAIGILRGDEIVFANAAWRASLQREAEEIVGQQLSAMVHEADRPGLDGFLSTDVASAPREFRFGRKDGTTVVLEIIRSDPFDYGGAAARLIAARDVTERNRLRAQVMLSERLASIGTLAAGVAHEINNPLTYVLSNLEYLRERLDDGDLERAVRVDFAEVVADAITGADRVRVIVRDLRSFSRPEHGGPARANVNEVIELALKMAANELRHHARVRCELGEVPPVSADEGRLGQIFLNLLVNAAQSIAAGAVETNEVTVRSRLRDDGVVAVEVEDTGAGIPPDVLPRIFDPFFTTKPIGVGTGLGLSISHAAVRSFGGDISVASQLGRGSTFMVTLPVAPQADSQPPVDSTRTGSRRGRILVVDDEASVGASLERNLSGRYDVVVAQSGHAALDRLTSQEHIDLVLCDVMMPDMTGMQLYERAQALAPQHAANFVFMTGGAFTQAAREFLGRVPNVCVDKPFNMRELRELIERRLGA